MPSGQTPTIDSLPARPNGRPLGGRKLAVSRAFKLWLAGASYAEIGRSQNVSPQAVQEALKPLIALTEKPQEAVAFRDSEAEILDSTRVKLVSEINASLAGRTVLAKNGQPVVVKPGLRDVALAYGVLFDKQRLLRGESTANVSSVTRMVLEAERREWGGRDRAREGEAHTPTPAGAADAPAPAGNDGEAPQIDGGQGGDEE